jgi:hypothetical protein
MFSTNSGPIDQFRGMLDASDGRPSLVVADSTESGPLGVAPVAGAALRVWPNPSTDGVLWIEHGGTERLRVLGVHDARGRAVQAVVEHYDTRCRIVLPDAPGLYFLRIRVGEREVLERVIRGR